MNEGRCNYDMAGCLNYRPPRVKEMRFYSLKALDTYSYFMDTFKKSETRIIYSLGENYKLEIMIALLL